MARRRLIWKIAPAYIMVIAVSTIVVAYLAGQSVEAFLRARVANELTTKARLIGRIVEPLLLGEDRAALALQIDRLRKDDDTVRVTLIALDGQVLGDTHVMPDRLANQGQRPEVRAALLRGKGFDTRTSDALLQRMTYMAITLNDSYGKPLVVVRTSMSVALMDAVLNELQQRIAIGGVALALLAGLVTFVIFTRHVSGPIRRLQEGAQRFAAGDLTSSVPLGDSREVSELGDALNLMARRLDEQIAAITRESTERQAVLGSMIEGVLAVDAEERVLTMNAAAAALFQVDAYAAEGRPIVEMLRHTELQELVTDTLASDRPIERDLLFRTRGRQRHIQAHGAPLRDTTGTSTGAVVVLHDVTRIHDLEQVRRQFVANVSHELKTPISAIHAAVETLLDPRGGSEEDNRRFLGMIERQADRLNNIVEDLLALARLEQQTEGRELDRRQMPLAAVIRAAVETCQPAATSRNIKLTIRGDEHVSAHISPTLVGQAVVNLLDNAVKYCGEGSSVTIKAEREDRTVVISVSDDGPGIPADHLPRLFERFYRVDRGRSRELGGTGLGLAIVKHVAQAHGGSVTVQSVPGEGSTFRIHLPISEARADYRAAV
jgi:two-component system phosphate regulon sensor histidine kinase PhoR